MEISGARSRSCVGAAVLLNISGGALGADLLAQYIHIGTIGIDSYVPVWHICQHTDEEASVPSTTNTTMRGAGLAPAAEAAIIQQILRCDPAKFTPRRGLTRAVADRDAISAQRDGQRPSRGPRWTVAEYCGLAAKARALAIEAGFDEALADTLTAVGDLRVLLALDGDREGNA